MLLCAIVLAADSSSCAGAGVRHVAERTARARFAQLHDARASNHNCSIVQRSKKLLLVDGDPGLLERLRRTMIRWSVVDTACSAGEALLKLDASRFDAIVCEHALFDHDGIWLLRRVRAQHPKVLRVLSSARDPQLFRRYRPNLVERYLPKPIALEELLRLLNIAGGPRYVGARL